MLTLLDRRDGLRTLVTQPGDSLAAALLRNGVPPTSVVTFRDESTIVPDDHVLDSSGNYVAKLIEGYDIVSIRQLYSSRDTAAEYVRRHLSIAPTGALTMERVPLNLDAVSAHVEQVVYDTITQFQLLTSDDSLLIGLSGGVDSGSLLMLLAKYRESSGLPGINIHAATFQDFDSKWSETFDNASRIAERFGVKHQIVEPGYAEDVFHLNRPMAQILMSLMETEDAHFTMYADHHSTRRVLEAYGDEIGVSKISLGLHTTDLLAGLLNSYTTGFEIGKVPVRAVGDYTYVFPLAFVPKRELYLYYTQAAGYAPKQTTPNQWEFNPTDRNFLYYIAEQLQWYWPGIEKWMFTAHNSRPTLTPMTFTKCENCGASVAVQHLGDAEWSGLCDVCVVLNRHGWISH